MKNSNAVVDAFYSFMDKFGNDLVLNFKEYVKAKTEEVKSRTRYNEIKSEEYELQQESMRKINETMKKRGGPVISPAGYDYDPTDGIHKPYETFGEENSEGKDGSWQ